MARKQFPFGELDGEKIDVGQIKLSGERLSERKLEDGETIMLIVEAFCDGVPTIKRKDGQLIRTDKVTVQRAAIVDPETEPATVELMLGVLDDEEEQRTGRARLPFEK